MTALDGVIAAELDRPAPEAVRAIVAALLDAHGDAIAAILFYGSCRRTGDMASLLDVTVLHDGHRAYHRRLAPAVFNAMLPPNVALVTAQHGGQTVRAKVAILSRGQFARRMRPGAMDTTVWARFCQPASLVHARDAGARHFVVSAIARGIGTAALWAVRLGPASGTAEAYWTGLFARTYAVELRPERAGRPQLIYSQGSAWFDSILKPGLAGAGVAPTRRWRAAWSARWAAGRALNVARLVKAAFTFQGAAAYVAWKIERHTGVSLVITPWQHRHPLLATPALLAQLHHRAAPTETKVFWFFFSKKNRLP